MNSSVIMEIKLISCPLCSHPHFNDIDTLRLSLVNIQTSVISCPICSENFCGLEKLTTHLFDHISDSKEILQNEIDKQINSISESQLRVEENVLASTEAEIIKCDICNFSFTDRNILELHQKLLHQTCPDKTGIYNYHCHLCSKQFKMRGSLMVHLRIAHYGFVQNNSQEYDADGKRISRSSGQTKHKVNSSTVSQSGTPNSPTDKKQWTCDICTKTFTTKYFLKKHKRLHTGEMPYCCSLCNKNFTFQQSYHKHMLYHSSEKPYSCNECGRAFKELSTLQNHTRIHSGERPFTCETCGKNFRQRISYLVHRRIHTGAMPYKCTACNKSFRYKVSQKSHKCPMNHSESATPPKSSLEKQIKVDEGDPSNSIEPNCGLMKLPAEAGTSASQKTSILVSCDPHIEISYNAADLESDIKNVDDLPVSTFVEQKITDEMGQDISQDSDSTGATLKPIISNVEQLYLNGDPDVFFLNTLDNP